LVPGLIDAHEKGCEHEPPSEEWRKAAFELEQLVK
jgi:hypothetical protein